MLPVENATVVARDVSKTFMVGKGGRKALPWQKGNISVPALRDINLVARRGQCIGVIGKNGSGKSTLMRLLSGAEAPTTGDVLVSGKPTLLSVNAALQNQLDAETNIRLGLMAMGLSNEKAAGLIPDILEWTELQEAIGRPIATFSSGMRARLKFGIATAVRREILLVDEALSTGDSSFTEKAEERMRGFLEAAGTVFIVSHSSSTIRKFCNRAIWLHEGEMIADGDTEFITKTYLSWSRNVADGMQERANELIQNRKDDITKATILFDREVAKYLEKPSQIMLS
ncbi:ABC transporter ATP-binding protein [Corynebacterium sp.]|uniref:ABC transporter ATP-binding protein n=1 Tax=Corynebacterium sp. TaxID=1720 RepID=UPI0026DDAE22|nr:ABC transporter ATP-binding protein [Corynebacterium sp.]MDO5031017.1 ABC transporter ATP-binding protein [Corynebacterium sp.]